LPASNLNNYTIDCSHVTDLAQLANEIEVRIAATLSVDQSAVDVTVERNAIDNRVCNVHIKTDPVEVEVIITPERLRSSVGSNYELVATPTPSGVGSIVTPTIFSFVLATFLFFLA
jgi:hypothetical protein